MEFRPCQDSAVREQAERTVSDAAPWPCQRLLFFQEDVSAAYICMIFCAAEMPPSDCISFAPQHYLKMEVA